MSVGENLYLPLGGGPAVSSKASAEQHFVAFIASA